MPNYEVEVKVTLQVDTDEPQTPKRIKRAAKQAVTNALQFAYDNGFTYDLAFCGRDYSKVGDFAYIPVANIGRSVEAAFEKQTGHKRVHIIHYSEEELYDSEGNPTSED